MPLSVQSRTGGQTIGSPASDATRVSCRRTSWLAATPPATTRQLRLGCASRAQPSARAVRSTRCSTATLWKLAARWASSCAAREPRRGLVIEHRGHVWAQGSRPACHAVGQEGVGGVWDGAAWRGCSAGWWASGHPSLGSPAVSPPRRVAHVWPAEAWSQAADALRTLGRRRRSRMRSEANCPESCSVGGAARGGDCLRYGRAAQEEGHPVPGWLVVSG